MSQSPAGPDTAPQPAGSVVAPPELRALGRCLVRGREARGLGREALAGQLNMGMEQLQALEEGDLVHLPEPVFIIAQARRIASHLQLDAELQIQALRQALTSTAVQANSQTPSPPAAPRGEAPTPPAPGARGRKKGGVPAEAHTLPNAVAAPPAEPAIRTPHRGSVSVASLLRTLALLALLGGLGVLGAVLGSSGWRPWQILQQRFQEQTRLLLPPRQPQAPTRPPAPLAPAPPELELSTTDGPSWLEVKTLEGELLFRGEFSGQRRFPLGSGLKLLAGRADLVQVRVAGAPARPLGTIEEVNWQTFTPEDPAGADAASADAPQVPSPTAGP